MRARLGEALLERGVSPRIFESERVARREHDRSDGLWNEDWQPQKKLSRNAMRAEHNLGGGESFQSWVARELARSLYETIHRPGATWAKAHETLARHGVGIELKGSGMVVTTTLEDGRVLAAKASHLGKWASKSTLEKQLGPYEVLEKYLETLKQQAQKNYESAVREQRAFRNETQNSRAASEKSGESGREIRAAERAAARIWPSTTPANACRSK
jgi:hypothetical protein